VNSQNYFAKFFIKEICVLGESCISISNLLTSLDSESKSVFFEKEVVDGFSMAATGVVLILALYKM